MLVDKTIMGEELLNFQTQSTTQAQPSFTETVQEEASVQKGQLDTQAIQANMDVDPSTKDDECMSSFQAHKSVKEEQFKSRAKKGAPRLNSVAETEDSKKVNEQDHRSKRVEKQTLQRLTLINDGTAKDLKQTVLERSNALFSGSERQYRSFFKQLDGALLQNGTLTLEDIRNGLMMFEDIAEQHNALQIVLDVWERKLTQLEQFSEEMKQVDKSATYSQDSQDHVNQQADNLKKSIKSIRSEQDRLMGIDRNRIEDSYVLAPLLRETTAHLTHSITLPPKDFNALILDKILPLKGDAMKVFDCLLGNLVDRFEDRRTAVVHFSDNLSIVMKCLSSELKSCPEPSIASAIANTCRTVEKLGTVQNINEQMVQRTADTFPRLF